MNKMTNALVVLLLFAPVMAVAQQQFYFREGDTIVGRDTTYFYQWWTEGWLEDDSNHSLKYYWEFDNIGWHHQPQLERLKYCYTDVPIQIVGIAGAFWLHYSVGQNGDGTMSHPTQTMETSLPEYIRLYDAGEGDYFQLLKEVEYRNVAPVRYMKVDLRAKDFYTGWWTYYDCHDMHDYEMVFPIHEFYFDKPVTIQDSFYIGFTGYNKFQHTEEGLPTNEYLNLTCYEIGTFNAYYESYMDTIYHNLIDDCDSIPLQKYKFRIMDPAYVIQSDSIDTSWFYFKRAEYLLLFPIVMIDSSFLDGPPQYECPPIENLHVGHYGEHNVVLLWNPHDDHGSYQVSLATEGTPPDSGTLFYAPINAYSLTGLDSNVIYNAYVRALCQHDSIVYSQWSDPVELCLCDSSNNNGFYEPDNINNVRLVPNPASGEVTLFYSTGTDRIEIYNLQGSLWLKTDTNGNENNIKIDISSFPKGIYIVTVHSPLGTTSHKLLVQ